MADSGYMTKELMQGLVTIGWSIGTSLTHILRDAIWQLKIASEKTGENAYKDYLRTNKGKKFSDEIDFIRVAEQKKSDIVKASVSKDDVLFLQKTCQRYGVDFHLRTRPENLQELFDRKYKNGEILTARDSDVLKAFILTDPQGNEVMDPKNPDFPLLKNDDYLLTFRSTDINKWEIICEKLEERNTSIQEKIEKAKLRKEIKTKEHQEHKRNKQMDGFNFRNERE